MMLGKDRTDSQTVPNSIVEIATAQGQYSPVAPSTFQFPLARTHSRVRRTFSGASTCPGVTSSPPPLRTFNLPQFAYAKRSCNLLLPVLAQGEEDFKSLLAYTRSRLGGPFNLFSSTPARGEEVLKNFILYLRSPAGDEGFRTMCFKTLR